MPAAQRQPSESAPVSADSCLHSADSLLPDPFAQAPNAALATNGAGPKKFNVKIWAPESGNAPGMPGGGVSGGSAPGMLPIKRAR